VSILNFHYASPPVTVPMNHGLGRVIGDNETGFRGTADDPYRREAWAFILSGGALFNHLDYSFTVDHEDGTFPLPESQPGGGGASIRRSLRALKSFLSSFDFVHMSPDAAFVRRVSDPEAKVYTLARKGVEYAVFIDGGRQVDVTLDVPGGGYDAEWIEPRTGQVAKGETFAIAPGGQVVIASPRYDGDIALAVRRRP
jgi:hypothetical protein